MNYKKIFRNVTLGILLFWGTAMTSKVNQSDKGIDDLFYKLFESEASRKPQELTRLGYFEKQGSYSHNAFLNDVSPKAKTILDVRNFIGIMNYEILK